MFEKINNEEIAIILDELIVCLGVKEEMPYQDLVALIRKRAMEECVQKIARLLDLPIRIDLSYVSKDYRPGKTDGFRSSALVETDWRGRGNEGITAQVSMPEHMPMFGSTSLQGYPVKVRISENCNAFPEAFIAVMAHELSHVLLASLWSRHKDSELHTDLVPIILGFRRVVEIGRKTVESNTDGDVTITNTTKYGYLTDAQFGFACSHVEGILRHHQQDKKLLLNLIAQVRRRLFKVAQSIERFNKYIVYIDRHPAKKMNQKDAQSIVLFHAPDYAREWGKSIAQARACCERVKAFAQTVNHYTNDVIQNVEQDRRKFELNLDEIRKLNEAIDRDVRLLRRYVGFFYKCAWESILGIDLIFSDE